MGSIWCTDALLNDRITQPMPFAIPKPSKLRKPCPACESEAGDATDKPNEPPQTSNNSHAPSLLPPAPAMDITAPEPPATDSMTGKETTTPSSAYAAQQPKPWEDMNDTSAQTTGNGLETMQGHDDTFIANCGEALQDCMVRYEKETGRHVSQALLLDPDIHGIGQTLMVLILDFQVFEDSLTTPEMTTYENGMVTRRLGSYHKGRATFTCSPDLCRKFFKVNGGQVDLHIKDCTGFSIGMPARDSKSIRTEPVVSAAANTLKSSPTTDIAVNLVQREPKNTRRGHSEPKKQEIHSPGPGTASDETTATGSAKRSTKNAIWSRLPRRMPAPVMQASTATSANVHSTSNERQFRLTVDALERAVLADSSQYATAATSLLAPAASFAHAVEVSPAEAAQDASTTGVVQRRSYVDEHRNGAMSEVEDLTPRKAYREREGEKQAAEKGAKAIPEDSLVHDAAQQANHSPIGLSLSSIDGGQTSEISSPSMLAADAALVQGSASASRSPFQTRSSSDSEGLRPRVEKIAVAEQLP